MRKAAGVISVLLAMSVSSCADAGTDPLADSYRIQILDGDNQTGLVGSPLPDPLRVVVRDMRGGAPAPGVLVGWSLTGATGATLSPAASATDAAGVAATSLTLGAVEGEVRIVARIVESDGSASAGFVATAASNPTLAPVDGPATAGDVVLLRGSGFIPDPSAYVVTFSGVHASLESVGPTELSVRVPPCLPVRTTLVRVEINGRSSNEVPVDITGTGPAERMGVGEDRLLVGPAAVRCRRLGLESGEEYLLSVQSVSTATAGIHPYVVFGLGPEGEPALTVGGVAPNSVSPMTPWATSMKPFHHALRLREREVPPVTSWAPSQPAQAAAPRLRAAPPSVGDTVGFEVLSPSGGLDQVFAVLRVLTQYAEIYVDVAAPEPGFSEADLGALASDFDGVVYPTVERAYGSPSDLDGTGRIVLLFTPAVNRLTPRGSGALVAGFFFAGDLSPTNGSAPAERFYAAVPDPGGAHADPLDRDFLIQALPAVLAHEFQHMVHYNQRVLLGGAERVEALWLQEALAQMAEELVAEEFDQLGDAKSAVRYRAGNLDRAQRYLTETGLASLTVTSRTGSLAERGGGWLFARYVTDHFGGEAALGRMTRSTALGSATVVEATGESWSRTFSDFSVALYLDGLNEVFPSRFGYLAFDLREILTGVNSGYPLAPERLGQGTFARPGSLRSASSHYFVLAPDGPGELAITFVGEDGAAPPQESGLQVRVVRQR